ncbi:AraC family transcriptional regulator [Ideonella sp. BN130291]|uniref:AraC family transcriptional regulator n=1 Tax=Ideonella sp. BN130291 TaxID=3112940 RepID=UPI002E26096B|nr:AraC family transcriptional regulator [Ideonella sp. BN130291]
MGRHPTEELDALQQSLARTIGAHTQGNEDRAMPIPNVMFFRREAPTEPSLCQIEPSIVLVAQGAKRMLLGSEAYAYDTERFLITSLDVPANSQAVVASKEKPCLGLCLKLDLQVMADLIAHAGLPVPTERPGDRSVGIGHVTPRLLGSIQRLLDLLDEPASIPVLAPLIQREIHYRLLAGEQAAHLWQIASVGSQGHRISRAIDWLKLNFALPLRVDELAARVQMSTSTLNLHFRQLTTMSPLQYQKWLRLNEARRLMLNEGLDAATAAFDVGYESPSQFSREYSRLFGMPPKRDIVSLRRKAALGAQPGHASGAPPEHRADGG